MGSVMESKLVAAFKFFDVNGNGTIEKDDLTQICKQLDPCTWTDEKLDAVFKGLDKGQTGYVDYSEFAVWVTSGMPDGKHAMNIYKAVAAKMPGERLADGDQTDAGLEKMRSFLSNALDIKPEEYGTPKATTRLTWLREVAILLDPTMNPGGFRICQPAVAEQRPVTILLGLAKHALSDAVVNKSLEVLARAAFSNGEAASEVASNEDFLPTLHAVLSKGVLPEQLTALQLVQAIAASSGFPKVKSVLPQLLAEVTPLLACTTWTALPRAAFDVLVSVSFEAPDIVLGAASWMGVASWLAESTEAGRPVWLDQDNLTVLASGFLAAKVLALPVSTCANEAELQLRQTLQDRLSTSSFLEFFVLAMEAAVAQREWPAYSGAFHSVSRMTSIASVLAGLGFQQQLVGVVAPLAKAVELNPYEEFTGIALLTLGTLVNNLSCLEMFLTLTEFRSETLEVLHKTGDEKAATDLLSSTAAAENALAAAHTTLGQAELKSPPSIKFLAELFNNYVPMDGELSKNELLEILPKVPIGPAKDVEASLSGDRSCKFGFSSFVQHIYGTPTMLGWWPSLMEDTDAVWNEPAFQELHPPSLSELLFHYELGAKGMSGVTSDVILSEVLPAWGQPVEGDLVEDMFAEIRGETLGFKEFGLWMRKYFFAVDRQQREIEKAQVD